MNDKAESEKIILITNSKVRVMLAKTQKAFSAASQPPDTVSVVYGLAFKSASSTIEGGFLEIYLHDHHTVKEYHIDRVTWPADRIYSPCIFVIN